MIPAWSRSATPRGCGGPWGWCERPAEPDPDRALGAEAVFCVTGAAGSIVSAITADLAAASGGTFHLLDLVAEPDPTDPDLARFASDRDGLKRELAERIKERGERPTPKLVERELARIERARAALDAVEAVREAGGKAYWHQVDLTDPDQVSAAVQDVLSGQRPGGRSDPLRRPRGEPLPAGQAAVGVRPGLRREGRAGGSTF